MFNWLTVLVLLPLEIASGMLYRLTDAITSSLSLQRNANSNPEFLTVITRPLTELIVQVRDTEQRSSSISLSLLLLLFQLDKKVIQDIATNKTSSDTSLLKRYCSIQNTLMNGTSSQVPNQYCSFIFARIQWPDWGVGLLLLIVSILCLCLCLVFLVKVLQSLLKGAVRDVIFKVVNSNFPGVFAYATPYLAMLVSRDMCYT